MPRTSGHSPGTPDHLQDVLRGRERGATRKDLAGRRALCGLSCLPVRRVELPHALASVAPGASLSGRCKVQLDVRREIGEAVPRNYFVAEPPEESTSLVTGDLDHAW